MAREVLSKLSERAPERLVHTIKNSEPLKAVGLSAGIVIYMAIYQGIANFFERREKREMNPSEQEVIVFKPEKDSVTQNLQIIGR